MSNADPTSESAKIQQILDSRYSMAPDRSVSVEQCADWRREIRAGGERSFVAMGDDDGWSRYTVRQHVKGNCTHDHGVPPVVDS